MAVVSLSILVSGTDNVILERAIEHDRLVVFNEIQPRRKRLRQTNDIFDNRFLIDQHN